MILPTEYLWLESYLNNDIIWLEDTVNWEEAFDLALSELTIYSFLVSPFFSSSYFFLDSHTKLSFLDIIFLLESNKINFSRELYDLFIWDLATSFSNKFLPSQFLFYTDYQDYMTILLYYSPELVLALNDYVNIEWLNSVFSYAPATVFDLFNDSIVASIAEFCENIILFFLFIWLIVIFINIFHLLKVHNPLEIYIIKLFSYIHTISREMRVQFESMVQTIFFFVFYWSMLIATFDDDQEELIEIFDTGFFFFFHYLLFF